MVTRSLIDDFLSHRKLALVGVSRGGKKYGNAILKDLTTKGYQVYPVHPNAAAIDGHPCWPSLLQLAESVGGVVIVVPPPETEKVVRDVVKARIPRVWMQPGAESAAAIRCCEENRISVVHGECIMISAKPPGPGRRPGPAQRKRIRNSVRSSSGSAL